MLRGPWNEEFIEELVAFDKGHDDQVDAAAGVPKLDLSVGSCKSVHEKL